ncbi:MAG: site-specific DNA-methyltransferase [Candidatus Wallbacteria bacterium HGW-Wallbacteria-1]|uniref:Site-specific DNA-methyltransferase n=1 Tax=Candidatus Wallbacteria bacterium HGW-Wallbacteria-1 TaxID=2013854 RepID=A0A2N1PM07_9BACT|nr:MAG: site-specific DNA-methyltransferase [Candidatus Wallbacteria bacterium HGW-Wallbacteria-1]
MEKMKMHSPNLTQENIARIQELFPGCVTEVQDEGGKLRFAVDFDQLRQELSESMVEGPQERYHLNWPGKREALLTANAPIAKTLRPCREESVDFDTTKNLFIEGDNLDALKLLQETYLGKVKMIYIDPPYNTGNDFIYEDDFAENAEEFLKRSNQKDDEGNRLVANTESNGRFHSDWLSMIYPRLKLARNLLKDDGVIFISIDDNEAPNLRKVCDEIFGAENFIAEFIWKRRASSAMADNNVSADHEYVIAYQKGSLEGFIGFEKDFKNYQNPDNDPRGPWVLGDLTVGMTASMRPNQAYDLVDPQTGIYYPHNPNRVWAYIPSSMQRMLDEGRVVFPDDPSRRPMQKRFKNELKSTYNPLSSLIIEKVGLNTEATRLIQQIMGGNIFDYSKPLSLFITLIPQICNSDDIILDFFAGSATTAHAVMQLNAEDGGNRKFIMVQLSEPCNEKSEAFKAGYKTIAQISKERIRRAGKKILEGECHQGWKKDIGFRVLKIDSSNMADIYYTPDVIDQSQMKLFTDNIKADRKPEDLLFQVLLDWGVDLSLPIRKETIRGKTVFFVNKPPYDLIACFDTGVNEELVRELARFEPLRVVFRDGGFASDAIKINVEQIFRQLSPHTEVKAI